DVALGGDRAARPKTPVRQPPRAEIEESDGAARSVQMWEAPNPRASAVASLAGSNQREQRKTTDMNEAAQPTPTTARPTMRSKALVEPAIQIAPATASSDSADTVRRAP